MKNNIQLVGDIKEKLCYLAPKFLDEIKKKSKEVAKHYILPDPIVGKKGFVTDNL